MAEYMVYFVIAFFVGLVFILMGVCQYRSKTPVTMNTGEKPLKPEQLKDVKAWNREHGKAYIVFGILLMLTLDAFPVILRCRGVNTVAVTVVFLLAVFLELAGLMAYHNRLQRRYRVR